jgi:predicted outer membrane protein
MMKKFFAMAMLLLGLVACGEQNKQTPDTPTFTKQITWTGGWQY